MKCLLCNLQFIRENVLKKHYVGYHLVNEDDIHFRELFKPDAIDRKCRICRVNFDNTRMKKKHMFLFHYGTKQQIGGRGPRASDLLLNIIKRGPTFITQLILTNIKIFMISLPAMLLKLF